MSLELSILMPCLNEEETLEICIKKAKRSLQDLKIEGEVLIADNGSTDGSIDIAKRCGARVIHVPEKGYGNALLGGIEGAYGKYIIMGDADDSYDFSDLSKFITKLREGYDLVMGNRFKGTIKKGAMPFLHKYLGNPVLSFIGRLFFSSKVKDFHCGLRGVNRQSILDLKLQTTGMEFASEMILKASIFNLKISEVPIILHPDGRTRPPHLRTWRDGWRHLRFMLLYSPRWLFFYPGIVLTIGGLGIAAWVWTGQKTIGLIKLDVHTLLYAAGMVIVGIQAIYFAMCTKIFAMTENLIPDNPRIRRLLNKVTLEYGLFIGFILIIFGLVTTWHTITIWSANSFGDLDPRKTLRLVIPAVFSLIIGFKIVFYSFFFGVLKLGRVHLRIKE